ncbi:MAG: hypothetical protein SNH27_14360 [Rikenellaceae bacterium]
MKRILLPLILMILVSCSTGQQSKDKTNSPTTEIATPTNSIYYWRTVFQLNETEEEFLKKYDVKKLYLRMFDVMPTDDPTEQQYSMIKPNATTIFKSPIPEDVEVAPTVYITFDALKYMKDSEKKSAELIANRILTMAKANKLVDIKEIQVDCDWTKTTEKSYFAFCRYMRDLLHSKGIALSSTIRLHQLRGNMPAVDRGTLMLYNTGSVKNVKIVNSILSFDDVEAYAKNIDELSIPLDFAYPTFSWGARFRYDMFLALMRCDDFSNTELYRLKDNGTYEVIKDHEYQGQKISKGETIRVEHSHFDEIKRVKTYIEDKIKQSSYSTIIYHLDSRNLSKYNDNEIKTIYNRN